MDKGYKYYALYRPFSLGCTPQPENNAVLSMVNYGQKEVHDDIEAWGEIVFEKPLTHEMVEKYELRAETEKCWVCGKPADAGEFVGVQYKKGNGVDFKNGYLCPECAKVLRDIIDNEEDE